MGRTKMYAFPDNGQREPERQPNDNQVNGSSGLVRGKGV